MVSQIVLSKIRLLVFHFDNSNNNDNNSKNETLDLYARRCRDQGCGSSSRPFHTFSRVNPTSPTKAQNKKSEPHKVLEEHRSRRTQEGRDQGGLGGI